MLQLLDMPADKMRSLQPVSPGSSADLLVGQRVFAIGNPFGLGGQGGGRGGRGRVVMGRGRRVRMLPCCAELCCPRLDG